MQIGVDVRLHFCEKWRIRTYNLVCTKMYLVRINRNMGLPNDLVKAELVAQFVCFKSSFDF